MLNPGLAFYRRMIKAMRLKFGGDPQTYAQFRYAIKMETWSHRQERDPLKIARLINEMDVARDWLLTDVMRADLQEDGKYKLKIEREHLKSVELKPVRNPQYFYFEVPKKLIA